MLRNINSNDAVAIPEPIQMKKVAKYIGCREKLYIPFVINWSARVVIKFSVAITMNVKPTSLLTAAGLLMLTGILLFSGSLYILSTTGIRSIGIITPIGGATFIVAWLMLAVGVWRG